MTNPQPPIGPPSTNTPPQTLAAPAAVRHGPVAQDIVADLERHEPNQHQALQEFRRRKARLERRDVTADMVEAYFQLLAQTGLKYKSAAACGLSYDWIRKLRAEEPKFVEWEEAAMEDYRDQIVKEAHRRAVEGVDEPIIGGKDRDIVVTVVKRYSDRLMELMLKRHIPEFREKWEGEVKVSGGVLIAPVSPSEEDWIKRHTATQLPDKPERDMIDAPEPPRELPS